MKKVMSLLLVIVTLCGMVTMPSLAATTAFDRLTTSKYAKVYTLSASGKTIPYTSSSLSTRGTVSYGASSSSYIANSTDELYLMDVGKTNGRWWAYVQYPAGTKRVKAYIPLSAITSNNGTHAKGISSGKFYCSLRANSATSSSYYVAKGDEVYLISTSGSKYQIMYPAGSVWRIAWCRASDYNRYVGTANSGQNVAGNNTVDGVAAQYGISKNSDAYKALQLINSKYASKMSASEKEGTFVFLFEGVGNNKSASARMNAMCVVVKQGNVVYLNQNCSTIPDYPFNPEKNDGTPMPTIKSGIYNFTTVNHRGQYAALNVSGAKVLRFKNQNDMYSSTSAGINVHRRDSDSIAPKNQGWVNSAGCLLIGKAGTGCTAEYARFIQAVGIVWDNAAGNAKYSNQVSGKIIIDRTYARSYLKNVGYSNSAINALG